MSFPDDNGVRLESENSSLQYWKHREQEPEFVTPGRRGANKYEVEANTPCKFTITISDSVKVRCNLQALRRREKGCPCIDRKGISLNCCIKDRC